MRDLEIILSELIELIKNLNSNETKLNNMLEWFVKKLNFIDIKNVDKNKNMIIYRGEIYWCELGENIGSEETKIRPCVIIQNQKGNDNSPTTIIAPITNSSIHLPIAVKIDRGIDSDVTGTIDLAQIRTISKDRLLSKISKLTSSEIKKVDKALLTSVGCAKFVYDNENLRNEIKVLKNEIRELSNKLNN